MLKKINRIVLFSSVMMGAMTITSCGDTNSNTPAPTVVEKPLPSSGESQDGAYATTGEVVVFFVLDKAARAEKPVASDEEIVFFQKEISETQSQLMQLGIASYTSTSPNIKITLSEQSKYVMNANASEKGIGFVMSKAGSKPEMVTKELTTDQMMAKIKTFYNK